ncbi:MAG TPA: EamA family transporter [Candidatus Sulfomarinibacteraceae bacterium]|nr:EamA family transporter [Candidatus Sulfomarinibacteraceae bacterium]
MTRGARAQTVKGFAFLILAAVLWGTVPVATSGVYRLAETNALSIGFFRLALSLLALAPAAWRASRGANPPAQWPIPRRDLALILLFGAAIATYQVCYFAAIPRVGVTVAALVTLCTAPVMVAVLAAALLGERLTGRVLLALVAAIAGAALLVGIRAPAAVAPGALLSGVLLALGAAFGFAVVLLTTRALTGRYDSLQLICIGMGSGALLLLPVALQAGLVTTYPPAAWGLLFYLGLAPTALGYLFFFYGLRFTTATVASIVNLLEPLTSTVLAWLLFAERLHDTGIVGAALLLLAMGLLYWRPSPPRQADY